MNANAKTCKCACMTINLGIYNLKLPYITGAVRRRSRARAKSRSCQSRLRRGCLTAGPPRPGGDAVARAEPTCVERCCVIQDTLKVTNTRYNKHKQSMQAD
eukprot:6212577-Pleurochrysis_carterae.AAC.2